MSAFEDCITTYVPSSDTTGILLEKIFELSRIVFAKEFDEAAREEALTGQTNAATDLEKWRNNLINHSGEIVYSAKRIGEDEEEVTAFAFTFERVIPTNKESATRPLHIWIAGCHPDQRRKHLMQRLFIEVEERAKEKGYTVLTVNTYPEKFENMPKFLESRNFELKNIIKQFAGHEGCSDINDREVKEIIKYCYEKEIVMQLI